MNTNLSRRRMLSLVVGGAVPFAAHAQAPGAGAAQWPDKPIKIIAPDVPGGGSDVVIRVIAPLLEQALGQPLVVDNRPGGGGRVGVEAAFRSRPDGYTLLLGNAGSNGINAVVYGNLPYDLERDFVPVSLLTVGPSILLVNPKVIPVQDVAGLVEYMRQRPGQVNFAITGQGGSAHMMTELFRIRTGLNFVTVPYRGGPEMAQAIMVGDAPANFNHYLNIAGPVNSGAVRVLAVVGARQSHLLPGVRTMIEQGFPDFVAGGWVALFAPRGTPQAVVERLQGELARLRGNAALTERLEKGGNEVLLSDGETLRQRVSGDIARWRVVAQQAKIRLD